MTLKRILCVEDEPDIQAVTRLALEMVGGYQVMVCSSGQEALDMYAGFDSDLILLDVMMPGMDGPTRPRYLRANPATSNIRVIFLTAKAQPSEKAHFRSPGVLKVISKPYGPLNLATQLGDIWSRSKH